jgi:NAD(P)H-dependent flavin oxidoreductase YrpB (nitropropane dioxygenase family)
MPPLHTPLCDLLGCRYPVMQAPMAGGPTTPELVAAVSQAAAATDDAECLPLLAGQARLR